MLNKVALITGCSSGIGLATAVSCLKGGGRVFAGLRKPGVQADKVRDAAKAAGLSPDLQVGSSW